MCISCSIVISYFNIRTILRWLLPLWAHIIALKYMNMIDYTLFRCNVSRTPGIYLLLVIWLCLASYDWRFILKNPRFPLTLPDGIYDAIASIAKALDNDSYDSKSWEILSAFDGLHRVNDNFVNEVELSMFNGRQTVCTSIRLLSRHVS